jgi:amidase
MDSSDIAYAGLARQAELLAAGEVTSTELVELCLERIARHDPQLNAFRVVLGEKALAEAAQADARRKAGGDRPLLGVPIAIKDDLDVAGEITGRGSRAHGGPATADAEIVSRLRAAGAVIVGKTNVPELEIHPYTETMAWGITRNPWDLERTSGGSSGGSSAAVAAGLVPAALASDGAGSIRIPAGCTGLVGFKPERGRVPTAPKVDPWTGLSTWGALTRRVADTALFMDVIADDTPGFAEAARREPGRLRVAIATKIPPGLIAKVDAEQRGAVETVAAHLRDLGHDVFKRELDYGLVGPNLVNRYFRGIADDAAAMAHPERLTRRTRGYARIGRLIPNALVARSIAAVEADRARLEAIDADVVLTPMFTRRPMAIGETEGLGALRTYAKDSERVPFCGAFNHTGQPAIAVPAGAAPDGFPLAVQLAGRVGQETTLISLAAQLEPVVGWADRRPPAFA